MQWMVRGYRRGEHLQRTVEGLMFFQTFVIGTVITLEISGRMVFDR